MSQPTESSFASNYWQAPPRPLESLAFIAPMLLVYEGSVLALGREATRNGADHWLRQMLDAVGFSQYFLLPVLTVSLLLGWHHLSHAPWRCSWQTVATMWLEAGVFALVLRLLAILGSQFTLATWVQEAGEILSYLGAGIYEELLFRVLLLPAIAWGLIYGGRNKNRSWQFAIALSSLLFAAAHYQWSLPGWDFAGEPFTWPSFLFRTAAGVFFAILFLRRGFGIAAGTHALYDILVGLNAG